MGEVELDTFAIPVTVLTPCQRFDLRRIPAAELTKHFGQVAKAEKAEVSGEALQVIARAADGSARDGLSLLDQAISHSQGPVDAPQVRAMLGLADAGAIYDLFEMLMRGDVAATLDTFGNVYAAGADPLVVLQELLTLCHWLTRLRVAPDAAAEEAIADEELRRSQALAGKLSVAALSRAWQMLLKGVGEVQTAPAAKPAADMVLIRLAYTAGLPPPGDIVKTLTSDQTGAADQTAAAASTPSAPSAPQPAPSARHPTPSAPGPDMPRAEAPARPVAETAKPAAKVAAAAPADFGKLVAAFAEHREIQLRNELYHNVRLVRYEPGRLEFQPGELAPADLSGRLLKCLREWFGPQWQVSVSQSPGAQLTLAEQDRLDREQQICSAREHPVVRAALEAFPGSRIERVTPKYAGDELDNPIDDSDQEIDGAILGEQTP